MTMSGGDDETPIDDNQPSALALTARRPGVGDTISAPTKPSPAFIDRIDQQARDRFAQLGGSLDRIVLRGGLNAGDQIALGNMRNDPAGQQAILKAGNVPESEWQSLLGLVGQPGFGRDRPLSAGQFVGGILNPVGTVIGGLPAVQNLPGPARLAVQAGASMLSPLTPLAPFAMAGSIGASTVADEVTKALGIEGKLKIGISLAAGVAGGGGGLLADARFPLMRGAGNGLAPQVDNALKAQDIDLGTLPMPRILASPYEMQMANQMAVYDKQVIDQLRGMLPKSPEPGFAIAILPDGTPLTGRGDFGVGAFQHLEGDLPPVSHWLDAGVLRIAWEQGDNLSIEIRGVITGPQLATLRQEMQKAGKVFVDITKIDGGMVKSIEGTPDSIGSQLAQFQAPLRISGGASLGEGGFLKGRSAFTPRAEFVLDQSPEAQSIEKLTEAVQSAKFVQRPQVEAMQAEARSAAAGRLAGIQTEMGGEAGVYKGLGSLKGPLTQVEEASLRPQFTEQEIAGLINRVNRAVDLQPFSKQNTQLALIKVLDGTIPTQGEIAMLEHSFGLKLAQALMTKLPFKTKVGNELMSIWNAPRTMVTMVDLSASLRQDAFFAVQEPAIYKGAVSDMLKVVFSAKNYDALYEAIETHPFYFKAQNAGLYIAPKELTAPMAMQEEAFVSKLFRGTPLGPLNEGSQRAYQGLLNSTRAQVFYKYAAEFGDTIPNSGYEALAKVINAATGRGNFGATLAKYGPFLNGLFFSPRFFVSRLQMPYYAVNGNPLHPQLAQQMAAQAMAKYMATYTGILALAHAGGAQVGLDPRSTDFGKMRVGPTRIDLGAGYLPIFRTLVRESMGQTETSSGNIIKTDRLKEAARFGQMKLAPGPGFFVDLINGKSVSGQELQATPGGVGQQAYSRLVPFAAQDINNAWHAQGPLGGLLASPTLLGVGVNTYYTLVDARDVAAQALPGSKASTYREASVEQKQQIDSTPRVAQLLQQTMTDEGKIRLDALQKLVAEKDQGRPNLLHAETDPKWFRDSYSAIQQAYILKSQDARPEALKRKADTPNEKALNAYSQAFKEAATGFGANLDNDKLETALSVLEKGWTPEQKQYVYDNTELPQAVMPQMIRDYVMLNRQLREAGYWQANKTYVYPGNTTPFYAKYGAAYEAWLKNPTDPKWDDPKRAPLLEMMHEMHTQAGEAKAAMRLANPALDAGVVRFYGLVPQTFQGQAVDYKRGLELRALLEEPGKRLNEAMRQDLTGAGFRTIQDVAKADDMALERLTGIHGLTVQAQRILEASK